MNLFEFEGKQILTDYGINIPKSKLIVDLNTKPDSFPVIMKAQVLSGGRAKAGGVQVCKQETDFFKKAKQIMELEIKGKPVHGLLCEEVLTPSREIYISITVAGVQSPTLIASCTGGIEIEEVASKHTEDVIKLQIDPFIGIKDYQIKELTNKLKIVNVQLFEQFIRSFTETFFSIGAELLEINPLGEFSDKYIAMDCKCVLDENLRSNKKDYLNLFTKKREILYKYFDIPKEDNTISYVSLDPNGTLGLISDGAGTGMLSIDMIKDLGGEVNNFCELGGTTSAEVIYRAMQLICEKNSKIKALAIVLIGGFNRMDEMADGILRFINDYNLKLPLFLRMCGTKEDIGIQKMKQNNISTFFDLEKTLKSAVEFILEN